jgi:hypothetical protein
MFRGEGESGQTDFRWQTCGSTFTVPPGAANIFTDDSGTRRREQIDALVEEIRKSKIARSSEEIAAIQERSVAEKSRKIRVSDSLIHICFTKK